MKRWCWIFILSFNINFVFADAGGDLNHFFNSLGFSGNTTSFHSYQSQEAGYVTMGSLYERNQVRDIQVMHVEVPGYRSGCGGIDLFAGGFSFIKSDQLIKFFQSILSSGGAYAFNLALVTEVPEIAHSLQFVHTVVDHINMNNLNSCSMGEDLVGGIWPKTRATNQIICQDIGQTTGVFSDWAEARQKCSTGDETSTMLDQANKDPRYRDRVLKNKNVVWEAIEKNAFLAQDQGLAEIYLSLSGTIVFDDNGGMTTYPSLITNQNFIRALLYGGQIPSYICNDDHCLSLSSSSTQTIAPQNGLVFQVETLLQNIYNNIIHDQPLTDEEKGIIDLTQSPVFSIISSDAEQRIGLQGSHVLAESVATQLLAQYLNNSLNIVRTSLAGQQTGQANEKSLYENLQRAQQFVTQFNEENRERFNQVLATNELVQNMQSKALNNLTPLLKQAYQDGES